MPFLAMRDGILVISQDFLERDWKLEKDAFHRGEVTYTCSYCGDPVHLVTRGNAGYRTQFFRHYADTACEREYSAESYDHAMLKKAVYDTCRAFGWEANLEVPGDGWQADVLARSGAATYAFEIQLSEQSGETLAERSDKYRASGITPVWVLRSFPKSCPFNVPRRTFRMWQRIPHGHVPEWEMRGIRWARIPHSHGLALVEEYLWQQERVSWRMPTVLTYWVRARAILATLDEKYDIANPRVRLWGQTTTLVDIVTRCLTGEVGRDFDAAVDRRADQHDELERRVAAAEFAKIEGVWEDFARLCAADMEKFAIEMNEAEIRRIAAEKAAANRRLEQMKVDAVREERTRCKFEDWENEKAMHEYFRRVDEAAQLAADEAVRAEQERIAIEALRKAEEETATRSLFAEIFWWVDPDIFDMDAAIRRRVKAAEERENSILYQEHFWWVASMLAVEEAIRDAKNREERERVKRERARRDAALRARQAEDAGKTTQVRFSFV